jgi:type II secretory pathway component GspD/PulD (secretin)
VGRTSVCLVALAVCAFSQTPEKLRSDARKAEKSGDSLRAYLLYSQAAGIDQKDPSSWSHAVSLQARALEAAHLPSAAVPSEFEAQPLPDVGDLVAARYMGAPLRLKPDPGTRSFDLRGDSKTICQQALKQFGIEVVFDADLQPLANLRFKIGDASFQEATDALRLATGTFFVPISPRMALVAKDVANKRQELEHTMAVAVPLPTTTTVQEAQELARAVQSVMEIQKFGVDPNQRMAVIRDRESKVLPALALFSDLLRYKSQIIVEVELFEANETSDMTLGFRWPTEFPIVALTKVFNSNPVFPAGYANFATFGGGASFLGLGIASSQLFATMAKSNGRALRRAEIRGVDGQAMNFHIGDKYPIITAGYFGDTGGATGEVYRPPPTFNFEDLGVVIKVTPHVHGTGEMTLEIESEYKVLTGQALNGIPVIASRSFKTSARMTNGDTAIVAGLIRASEARSLTGIAGLASLPALGHLFRTEITNKDSGQALLVIRPHLIDMPPSDLATRTVYTGTDGRPRIPI